GVRDPRRLRPGRRDHARTPAARRGALRFPDESEAEAVGRPRASGLLGRLTRCPVHRSGQRRSTSRHGAPVSDPRAATPAVTSRGRDARPVTATTDQALSFPRQAARTRNFTLGRPRSISVAADGSRVVFLRAASGTDPVNALWVLDVDRGDERLVADPGQLLAGDDDVPPEERARRERMREIAGGIVGY